MTEPRHPSILNYLRHILGRNVNSDVSDSELLRRFATERDEASFELLMWRHAGIVLHVCRQVLRDEQSTEDAFQATFLILARKAGSIGRRESLGSWLYRVAHRIAIKSQAQRQKRMTVERESERLDSVAAPASTDNADEREQRRIIAEEVQRLSANYRAAIVACYFEGKSLEEAGHQLG
jgi:HlyD family secretion protein